MAIDAIRVDTNRVSGAELFQAVNELERIRDQLKRIKGSMESLIAAPDYTAVQREFGLYNAASTEAAAYGEETYNLVAGTVAALDNANVTALCNRVMAR